MGFTRGDLIFMSKCAANDYGLAASGLRHAHLLARKLLRTVLLRSSLKASGLGPVHLLARKLLRTILLRSSLKEIVSPAKMICASNQRLKAWTIPSTTETLHVSTLVGRTANTSRITNVCAEVRRLRTMHKIKRGWNAQII